MTLDSRTIRSNGVELHLLDTGGSGLPVVILHGLAGSSTEFVATAEALRPEFRTVLVDQRAHGRSTRRPADTSRRAFVGDTIAVITRIFGEVPVRLVGQSMGAHTAILTAAERPDLIDRLVLLEGHVRGSDTPDEARSLGQFFASWPLPFVDLDAARGFLGDGALARAWIADLEPRPDGLWPRFDADVMESVIAGAHAPRWREWESLTVPTLAVFADKGMFTDDEKDELIAHRPRTQRVDLAGASHDAHLDAFDAWIGALRSYLSPPI